MQKKINKNIFLTLVILIIIILVFQFTNLDIDIQKYFYDFNTNTWVWDKEEPILKLLFYSGLKKTLIIFAISLLLLRIFFRKKNFIKKYKNGLVIVILSSIMVPLSINFLKAQTNTPCPKNIQYFGGKYPDVKVLDSYPKDFVQDSKIRCWPAGHASGGFALMALFFLFKKKKNKILALAAAITLGWTMGIYKMVIGDHFLSHTKITMLLSWLLTLLIVKIVYKLKRRNIAKPAKI